MDRRPDPEPYEGNVAGIVLLPFWSRLDDHGHLWWIAACFCGAGFGLLGLRSVRKRDRHVGRPQTSRPASSASHHAA